MNKILLIIVVLIVVFGAFILLANKNTNTPSETSSPIKSEASETPAESDSAPVAIETNSQVANVILGDSDFVPKDIIVKTGTRVVWKNSSGKSATVNSEDHPTHRLYPFLNLGEFPSSSSLQAVFDKAGKYSYHNHYNASETGTVAVE